MTILLDYQLGDYLDVLDHGHVALLDKMGSDSDIANAARVSYEGRSKSEDEALIRYLMRHKHTSPFEMAELKFELKMPIFVARQWVRHRTASMNEVSARYTVLPDEMYVPEESYIQPQSKVNKQGRDELGYVKRNQNEIAASIDCINRNAYLQYEKFIDELDLSREIARGILPLNTYTKFIWKIDLHNLLHFLKLRTDKHAQQEIRDYAETIEKLVALYFPITYRAWVDYSKETYTLSRQEIEAIQAIIHSLKRFTNLSRAVIFECLNEELTILMELSDREKKEFKEMFFYDENS